MRARHQFHEVTRGTAVAVWQGMRGWPGLALLALALAAGACEASKLDGDGTGTGGTSGLGGSPGTVAFILTTSPSHSYCDQLSCWGGTAHFSIATADGQPVNSYGSGAPCGTADCTTCIQYECPEIGAIACPAPSGVAYTGGTMSWDGSYFAMSTCGSTKMACGTTRYMPPGRYVAEFCATQGEVTQPDAGPPVCTATAAQECTQASFDFPSATPVQLTLPVQVRLL